MTPRAGDDGPDGGLRSASTGQLVRELVDEARNLVRNEVRLAKAELRQDVKETGRAGGLFGAAGAFGYAALLAFSAAVVLLLALVMPAWLAAAIVGLLLGIVAAVLGAAGRSTLSKVSGFEETIQTVKEDKAWASETMRTARSSSRATA